MTGEPRRNGAPAVTRALRVLELLADAGGSLKLTEVAERLELPKSTAHHVLAALIDFGWVERDPHTLEVTLGLRAWEVGQAYQRAQSMSQRARPFMDAVRDQLGETIRLGIRSGRDNVCIAKSEGGKHLVFDQRVGARLPAHATGLGKALLSGLDDRQLAELYAGFEFEPFTENTITSLADLQAESVAIRERGWAQDNGEYILGIRCVAVPILSRSGQVVAAMSVSGSAGRLDDARCDKALHALHEAAGLLSERLGDDTDRT
nr:IclR family transcriptional regulator [Phytoactinopolyspora alkaliphila]